MRYSFHMLQFLVSHLAFRGNRRRAAVPRFVLVAIFAYALMPFGTTYSRQAHAQTGAAVHRIYLPGVASAAGSTTGSTSVLNVQETAALALINQQRALAGCTTPVRISPELTAAARAHSTDMAVQDYFSHTGADGSKFSTRAQRVGYTGFTGGEIIAAGYTTAAGVVEGWLNSPPHRSIMLNCAYHEAGIGFFGDTASSKYLWTGLFGW